jgi:autotransporter translocation and assembly factor TamB
MAMKRRRGRWHVAAAIAALAALAFWQWPTLSRLAITTLVTSAARVRLSFGAMTLTPDRAVFQNVRVTSFGGEPIATIVRLVVTYDLRELLPGGKRLYGLESVEADSPHLVIVRHADGTYNVPIPKLPAKTTAKQRPLVLSASIRGGSIEITNESANAAPNQRHLYVGAIEGDANISSSARSTYRVGLRYGERLDRLYPVRGRGEIDPRRGYVDQHWTAAAIPIASAVNLVVNSPSLHLDAGVLRDIDVRNFALPDADAGGLHPHLAASATLDGGRLSIAGLFVPVESVRGPVDVYDDGLTTRSLVARVAGIAVRLSGGIYDLKDPHLRITIRGAGDLTQLRTAFAQARHLPMRGPLSFGLLVEGRATKPLAWIDLRSATITYASEPLARVGGLVAFDGREADVIGMDGRYRGVAFSARGRIALARQRNAIELILGAHAPSGAIPYAGALLPQMTIEGVALATASDPKAIAVSGILSGRGAARLDGIFNVNARGNGAIGPLYVRQQNGSLYARIALDRSRALAVGLARVRDFSVPFAHASVDATLFGGEARSSLGTDAIARVRTAFGTVAANGSVALRGGALEGGISGRAGGEGSFGAEIAGTPQSPRIGGTLVVAGGSYRHFDVNGNAAMTYADGTLQLRDTAVALGPLFVAAAGTITNVIPNGTFTPRYDLVTELHSSNVSALVAQVRPHEAALVQGSIDAHLHVRGTGSRPSFAGVSSLPEGSVNGLSFRYFRGAVSGDRDELSMIGGRVTVASTHVTLGGSAKTSGRASVNVRAPYADLSDFNDFFDRGDTFAGTGSLSLHARTRGTQILASNGSAFFAGARYHQLELGTVAATWRSTGDSIDTNVSLGGVTGSLHLAGSVAPRTMSAAVRAQSSNVDLATWLPMLGMDAPITGRLNAQATLAGRYPEIALTLHAALSKGTVGRLPIDRFDVRASASRGRGTIESAVLDVPSLATQASGSFGLRSGDQLALVAHSTSSNIGAFLNEATGKDFGLNAALDSTLRLTGTRAHPQIGDTLVLQALRYGNLTIPRVAAAIGFHRESVTVSDGEIDLTRGKAIFSAKVPIRFLGSRVAAGSGPIAASLRASGIELANFLALLPKGTQMNGRIDGDIVAGGRLDAPQLGGSLTLRDGSFNGPVERSPITGIVADLGFSGTSASLQSRATVGGGSLTAQATARLGSMRDPSSSAFDLQVRATKARLDLPAYFQGVLNGNVAAVRENSPLAQVSGDVALSDARIPLTAFLNMKGGGQSQKALSDIAFSSLRIAAGKNVRVQNANVDVGATGDVTLGGTLKTPTLDGSFRSTGGSLSFYRTFNLESGTVTFERSSGAIPDVDAVATTFVANPPTAVKLHVTGPVTNMNLAFMSQPSYSREQILGLLVGAQQFGAVRGINTTGPSASIGSAAQQFALGQVNTLFAQAMLQPLSASLANALGFTTVQITTDIQTGLGINAVKALGKNVNAIFAQSFGYPSTQAITLEVQPDPATGLRLTWYTSTGATLFALQQQPLPVANNVLNLSPWTQLPPPTGTNGITFSYVRKFP